MKDGRLLTQSSVLSTQYFFSFAAEIVADRGPPFAYSRSRSLVVLSVTLGSSAMSLVTAGGLV